MPAKPVFLDDFHFRIGEVPFHCSFQRGRGGEVAAPAGFLAVMKDRSQVDRYLRLCDELRPQVIVEFGIKWGGSTAFLHALNQPHLLVSFELSAEPAPALSSYIRAHGLESVVKPCYGIDQADRTRVAAIMTAELHGRPVDLVIDDASHLLDQTRASFEMVFPLLRPGGVYVIEDWNADHLVADALDRALAEADAPGRTRLLAAVEKAVAAKPDRDARLVRLPLELVLARASKRDAIREITVMDNWLLIRRGEEPLDPASFRLADLASDHFGNLRPPD